MPLQIGVKTSIPHSLFGKRLALLAMQGAGKTYTAGVIEEEMLDYIIENPDTNAKIIIMDPVGAHWGIREKFPIHIVGGDHGDIELDPESGHAFAQLSHDFNLSMLFDLSTISQDEAIQFVTDFSDKIFQITKTPTHIIYEEADMFAPQRPSSSKHKLSLAALDSIVRRGRGRGIGCTLITQRPAVISKNVLTQVDASIILNITGETDLKTIRDYLDSAGLNKKEIDAHVEKIMKFGKGHALLFSPSWLKDIREIVIRKRISYHSGAEPEVGVPNPADDVILLKMGIQPIIDGLNGEEVDQPEINPKARTNSWVTDSEEEEIEEEIGPGLPAYKKVIGVTCFAILFFGLLSAFS